MILPNTENYKKSLSLIISGHLDEVGWVSFSGSNWEALADAAQWEGVAPLVYWAFSQSGNFSSVPSAIQDVLRFSYSVTWMQNQKNFRELETVSHLFAGAKIPVVLLKGLCFALTIYPDIGLRPMGDMDVLVPQSSLNEAVQIATSLGYSEAKPEASPGLRDLLYHEVCLQKAGSLSTILEIHHSLVADKAFSYSVPVDWFWEQTKPLNALPPMHIENLLMLTPTAQLLYASAHAMLQHGINETPLRWYYDLDQIICRYENNIDWKLLLLQARKFEWGSALDEALGKTISYFDTPIPNTVMAELSKHSDSHRRLISLSQISPRTHILEEYLKLLPLNWYGRFRLVLALMVPTPAYMQWRYKHKTLWMLPFYYILRWAQILKDGVFTAFVLIFAQHQS